MNGKFPQYTCEYAAKLAEVSERFRRQAQFNPAELEQSDDLSEDPFGETGASSGVYGLKHRFPDRVLVMASNSCFMNCRHCTRKNMLADAEVVRTDEELQNCVDYVMARPQVRDVLISGGDPLVLPDDEVLRFVSAFSALEQTDVVRLCTRALCVNPIRMNRELASRLRECGKVWVNTQFNCVDEVTAEAAEACAMLVDAGIPVSCQTVLLAGVNDSAEELLKLFRALQRARVRPYYVFQCDPVNGTAHFRVSNEKAKRIAVECAERIGGLALPKFVADVPGAKRKIPIWEL